MLRPARADLGFIWMIPRERLTTWADFSGRPAARGVLGRMIAGASIADRRVRGRAHGRDLDPPSRYRILEPMIGSGGIG
jgi:hypothetical protein